MLPTVPPSKLTTTFLQEVTDNNTKNKLKVAAYCRVSTKQDEQEHSLAYQEEYYQNLITDNEKNLITSYIKKYAIENRKVNKQINLPNVLREWNENKTQLFKMLGNNLIISKHIKFQADETELFEVLTKRKEYIDFQNNTNQTTQPFPGQSGSL